jgi:phage shock protein A
MTFFQRFLTLAKADAHGVLDSLEDRSLMLKQCLRDAELELARNRVRRDELASWMELLDRQRQQLNARSVSLENDIRLAMDRSEESLARFSIRRLLSTRRQHELIDEQERGAREELDRLTQKVEAQERELEELRDRVEAQLARERALGHSACARHDSDPDAPDFTSVRDEEVELEFLRRSEQRETEGTAA